MKDEYYRQCRLFRQSGMEPDTFELMMSWIPEKIAKVGNIVSLKNEKGERTENWSVENVYDRCLYSALTKTERDYLKQRKASDI